MQELSDALKRFLAKRTPQATQQGEKVQIAVHDAISALAFYYEKVRSVIEFQDEHLLRQNAIRRILHRRLIFQTSINEVTMSLLKELVRSRYLRAATLPDYKVKEVEEILRHYGGVASSLQVRGILSDKDRDWLFSMAACAIDEALVPMIEEEALVHLMYTTVEPGVIVQGFDVSSSKRSQLYLACYFSLLKPDLYRVRYFLLKSKFPKWHHNAGVNPEELSLQYYDVRAAIEETINHPLGKKAVIALRRYRIPFVVLHTILKNNGESLLQDPAAFEKEVRRICEGMYSVQRRRLVVKTTRAIIYLFLTKMLLGLAVEVPYDLATAGVVHKLPVAFNVFVPPVILAFIALSVRTPKKDNTDRIVRAVSEIVYGAGEQSIFSAIRISLKKRRLSVVIVFFILYAAMFCLTAWLFYLFLHAFHFNWVGGTLFIAFVSLVTFFAISVRGSVKDLIMVRPKMTFLGMVTDILSLPVIQVGRWLSLNISRINVLVFVFDILIELPFQAFIEITEEWFSFLKEKKEEME